MSVMCAVPKCGAASFSSGSNRNVIPPRVSSAASPIIILRTLPFRSSAIRLSLGQAGWPDETEQG
jgi:hypothetical protein